MSTTNTQKITFLSPLSDQAPVTKTYVMGEDGPEAKVVPTDERMGYKFRHKTVECKNLNHFMNMLVRLATVRCFRIYGNPLPSLDKTVRRLKENFPVGKSLLIHIDIDKWDIPVGHDKNTIKTKEGLTEALYAALQEVGLTVFAETRCIVLQSNSAFGENLSCHLYYWVSGDGVDVETFRQWSLAFNKLAGEKVLDPQVYVGVQPDFIGKRTCEGFSEPMTDDFRLFMMDGLNPVLDSDDLAEMMLEDLKDAKFLPADATSIDGARGDEPLGKNWAESLKLAGKDGGAINEVCYRAAAQLVHAEGSREVERRIDEFAERFHKLLWNAITANNPDGERGGRNDRANYTLDKVRNDYIMSALKKEFGDGIDEIVAELYQIIASIKSGESKPSLLLEADQIEAMKHVQDKYPPHWADLREHIKKELRGIVPIKDIDRRVKTHYDLTDQQLAETIAKDHDWIRDEDDNLYLKESNSDNYALYHASEIRSFISYECATLRDGKAPNPGLINFVFDYLFKLAKSKKNSPFKKEKVVKRTFTEDRKDKIETWVNLKEQTDGEQRAVRITEDGVKLFHAKHAPVTWETTSHVKPILFPGIHSIREKFNLPDDAPVRDCLDSCANFLIERMSYYFQCKDEVDTINLLGFAINNVLGLKMKLLLQLTGPSESGKSTAADFMLDLLSPAVEDFIHSKDRQMQPSGEKDYVQIMKDRDIPFFDNLNKLSPVEQQFFTQVLTNIKNTQRILYSDKSVDRPLFSSIIITGLSSMIYQADLASRSITKEFSTRKWVAGNKKPIEHEWLDDVGFMRVGLYEMVSRALQEHRFNTLDVNRRDYWFMLSKLVAGYEVLNESEENTLSVIEDQLKDKQIETIFENPKTANLAAWILSEIKPEKREQKSPSEWFKEYVDWADKNAGESFKIGQYVTEITYENIPKAVQWFISLVNRTTNELQKLSGMVIDQGRTSENKYISFSLTGQPACSIFKIKENQNEN